METRKKVGNNTYHITYQNGDTAIRLHDTDIITYKKDKLILNTNGWYTQTTKNRINKFLPDNYSIHQKNYTWKLHNTLTGELIDYYDEMIIDNKREK